MSPGLHRLVYRSEMSILGTSEQVEAEIAAILDTSCRNNAACELTGVLLHSKQAFTQVLEGPLGPLEATYDRISADLRHISLDLVQFVPVAARSFAGWSMAYVGQEAMDGLWNDGSLRSGMAPEEVHAAVEAIAGILGRHRGGEGERAASRLRPQAFDPDVAAWAGAVSGARQEAMRLSALDALNLGEPGSDPELDAIAAEASAMLRMPMALVTLVDADRTLFQAAVGVPGRGARRSITFCHQTIRTPEVMVVADAASDPRFEANPLVAGEAGIRFYAGAPIEVAQGCRVGAVCVLDNVPHAEFGPQHAEVLARLAERVTALITARQAA